MWNHFAMPACSSPFLCMTRAMRFEQSLTVTAPCVTHVWKCSNAVRLSPTAGPSSRSIRHTHGSPSTSLQGRITCAKAVWNKTKPRKEQTNVRVVTCRGRRAAMFVVCQSFLFRYGNSKILRRRKGPPSFAQTRKENCLQDNKTGHLSRASAASVDRGVKACPRARHVTFTQLRGWNFKCRPSLRTGRAFVVHDIIGNAEALPILCVRYFWWERERERYRERQTEVTSPLSR